MTIAELREKIHQSARYEIEIGREYDDDLDTICERIATRALEAIRDSIADQQEAS